MRVRLLFLLTILTLLTGCAQGYYENPQAAYQQEATPQWYTNPYKNPETQQEYEQRLRWEDFESSRPRFWHR
jgi:hypothetical protein